MCPTPTGRIHTRTATIILPAIFVVLSSIVMWVLLTIVAVALSQQPKIRRGLMKELADAPEQPVAAPLAKTT